MNFSTSSLIRNIEELIKNAPDAHPQITPPQPKNLPETTGIPSRYLPAWNRPKDATWQSNFETAKNIIRGKGMLAITGKRGVGKTRLAAEVARDLHPLLARYTSTPELLIRLKATFAKTAAETEKDIVDELSKASLLIIDEFQERREAEWENTALTLILDKRYGAEKPTVIISNLKPKDFVQSLGESVFSRLEENGGFLEMIGESHRKNNRQTT